MKLIKSSRAFSVAAGVLMLGAAGIITVNAHDDGRENRWDRYGRSVPRPNPRDVMTATPDTYCASWVSGISRDCREKGESIQLGSHANDRMNPTYFTAYYTFPNWWRQKLTDVKRISASFLAPVGTINLGGSPRFNIDVMNADGTPSEDIIYLDPALCSNRAPGGWRDADFTSDKDGSIFDSRGVRYTGDWRQSAWEKLVSDPYYAGKKVGLLYLIQDASTGPNYVDRIKLDNAYFTREP